LRPVNLLPPRYRPARASGERPGIAYIAIGALAVLFVMVLLYVVTVNDIDEAENKTAQAQAEQQAAQARIGQLQAYGDFASLKTSREAAVAGVAELRFDYERLMREVALVLPHNTYLTAFSAAPGGAGGTATSGSTTATGPTVAISGCAPSHPAVATAIVRLRKLHNIESVDLASSTKATSAPGTAAGACTVTWVATLVFKPETPATSPVPVRLGGGQ
jgi:Tfp pilus assembly protein PilN